MHHYKYRNMYISRSVVQQPKRKWNNIERNNETIHAFKREKLEYHFLTADSHWSKLKLFFCYGATDQRLSDSYQSI